MDAWSAARTVWPAVDVGLAQFAAALADVTATQRIHAADLYLALACAGGDRGAIASFERRYMPKLAAALRRKGIASDVADDVIAAVREQLLFQQPPMIAGYAGRGTLDAWLRRVALRAAIKRMEKDRRATALDDLDELPALAHDPEIAYLSRTFGSELKRAVGEALGSLAPAERALLRRRLLDASTLDAIRNERVHRSTMSRRVAKVRERVIDDVHRRLGARLGLTKEEVLTLRATLAEDLELSLHRLLGARRNRSE